MAGVDMIQNLLRASSHDSMPRARRRLQALRAVLDRFAVGCTAMLQTLAAG
jgi:hypothetical protein